MNSIPSFNANLVQNPNINKHPAPSVEEILNPPVPDNHYQPQKSSHTTLKVLTAATALAGLGFLGRRGSFGQNVQKFLGGIPKLSTEQIQEAISSKLVDYISRTDAVPFTVKVLKNGKTTATRMLTNGKKEVISFSAQTGEPEFRVLFGKANGKKALNYITYKGPDILDDGFDTANNFYKKFVCDGIKRKYLLGPKHSTTEIIYGNMVRGEEQTKIRRQTSYYRNGKLKSHQDTDFATGTSSVRTMLYDNNKKLNGVELISNGTVIRKVKGKPPEVLQS